MLVQRQSRAAAGPRRGGQAFDRVVVGDQGHQARIGDPLQQPLVAPLQHGARVFHRVRVGLFVHLQQHLGKAGVQANHVAGLHHHIVFFQDVHQQVVSHPHPLTPEMRMQVDHHRTALYAALGHFFDAQGLGRRCRFAGDLWKTKNTRTFAATRADYIGACAKAVVVHRLGYAIAIGVEHRAHMRQAVPLGAVLQMHDHQVVAHHIGADRVVAPQLVVHVGLALAHRRAQHGRLSPGVEHITPRKIQRQAQVEGLPGVHLVYALQHFFGRQEVHAPALVIGAKVAPIGARGALFPAVG